jgi:adenylate kinase
MNLIMLAPPGAGKGTHCSRLTHETGVAHISSGDLLRAEMRAATGLGRRLAEYTGRGDLVPDEMVFALLMPVVVAVAHDTGGYLLDGFPRTLAQARRLAEIGIERDLVTDAVVYLKAPDPVLVERLLDRADREGRADDRPDVIRHRLAVFAEDTAPVVSYYRERGVLIEVDADRPVRAIRTDLRQRLADHGVLSPSAA